MATEGDVNASKVTMFNSITAFFMVLKELAFDLQQAMRAELNERGRK